MRTVRLSTLADLLRFNERTDDNEPDPVEEIEVPEDLQAISDEELEQLRVSLVAAFDAAYDENPATSAEVAQLTRLGDAVEACDAEKVRRDEERAEAREEAARQRARVHGDPEASDGDGAETDDESDETDDDDTGDGESDDAETRQPATVAASGRLKVPAVPRKAKGLNLAAISKRAPKPTITADPDPEPLAITAAIDIPGSSLRAGQQFGDLDQLAEAMWLKARSMPVTRMGESAMEKGAGNAVATIQNDYQHVLHDRMTPEQVAEVMDAVVAPGQSEQGMTDLVAAGGWCAPSVIDYDFFDVGCDDGMIDLPTVGIQRGGLRWPTSATLNDVFNGDFTNETNPWLWTETDDIAAVTGSPVKPCIRIPCPSFNEARLECYGLCVTVGNLTDNAYPESTRHYIQLLRRAMYRVTNQRYIQTIVAQSGAVITGGFFDSGQEVTSDVLAAAEWAIVDYKYRLGMCDSDVVELVVPFWLRPIMRASMSRRTGIQAVDVNDAQIADWFNDRRARVQFVKDYQVRGTNQPGGADPTLLYPTAVEFMVWAPGTFVLGNGMTLDLGPVRDSVLNETNDHTAVFSEECHLIAMRGPLSRRYSVTICASGRTGQANITDCQTS